MSNIKIGNRNKIKGSIIGNNNKVQKSNDTVLKGLIISIIAGVILMFSFWDKIIAFIEGLFA